MTSRRRIISCAALVILILAPGRARAQAASGDRSPGLATALSVAGTLAPMAFGAEGVFIGAIVGPSLGDLYGGNGGYGLKRSLLRTAVAGATIAATAATCDRLGCDFVFGNDDGGVAAAAIIGLAGMAAVAALGVQDVIGVAGRTRARNAERALALQLGPSVNPETRALGLGLSLRF